MEIKVFDEQETFASYWVVTSAPIEYGDKKNIFCFLYMALAEIALEYAGEKLLDKFLRYTLRTNNPQTIEYYLERDSNVLSYWRMT